MTLRRESLPQANIYSSKLLFDQMEDRNKKRMNQILKRKKALSTRNKTTKYEEEKIDFSQNNEKEEININTYTQFNKSIYTFNDKIEFISKKADINSLNDINNNNSTNINSNILNKDSQEKEISASSYIEEESKDILTLNKNQNSTIVDKNNSIINIDIINCDENFNDENKEKNYIGQNEFAIKYLSSSLDSFIKLDNHLVAKAKFQNNCFTDSYSQALDLNCEDSKISHKKNYLVTEIIKEEKEKEGETPLKIHYKREKNKNEKNLNENNEENKLINKIARRRAYSKRIRNNLLNRNLKDVFNNEKKTINNEKNLNTSKSYKKIKLNYSINFTGRNYCSNKNINNKLKYNDKSKNIDNTDACNNFTNNIARKTICTFKKKTNINLNSSYNLFHKNELNSNKINNCKFRKSFPLLNSSKNMAKPNERLCKKLASSKSNLIIFQKNKILKNKNDLNISMNNNLCPKLIRKYKLKNSKSAKRINDTSINYNLNDKEKNIQINKKYLIYKIPNVNNINKKRILLKNPTMGKLSFIKKTNISNKDKIPKIPKKLDSNKSFLNKSYRNENTLLNNTLSCKNIKIKKTIVKKIDSRNSMPFKQKAQKIATNILNTENNKTHNKLNLNKSYCNLTSKKINC